MHARPDPTRSRGGSRTAPKFLSTDRKRVIGWDIRSARRLICESALHPLTGPVHGGARHAVLLPDKTSPSPQAGEGWDEEDPNAQCILDSRCPDPRECQGALIGKALERLRFGTGTVEMLLMH